MLNNKDMHFYTAKICYEILLYIKSINSPATLCRFNWKKDQYVNSLSLFSINYYHR